MANRYAASGWPVVSHTVTDNGWGQMLLERPFQPVEAVPAPTPAGRGDEPTSAE